MSLRIILLLFVVALTGHGRTVAQDSALNEVYGAGVHAYFDGHHPHAISALTAAIDGGMKDARAYYFRGLAQARMGDLRAAADVIQGLCVRRNQHGRGAEEHGLTTDGLPSLDAHVVDDGTAQLDHLECA